LDPDIQLVLCADKRPDGSHKTTVSRNDCLNSHGVVVVNSRGQDACADPGTADDGKIIKG
jgi:hypothetical protein